MASWTLKNLDEAKTLVSGERMDSPSIGSDPIALDLAPNLSFAVGGAKLSINPRSTVSVAVLNDEQDQDADGVIAKDEAKTPAGALPPHFRLKHGPWLKLRAEAGIKAKVAADLSTMVGITAGTDAGVVVADYRRQAKSARARAAFLGAIQGPRFLTDLADVKGLGDGDALMVRRGGSIVAGVSVNAADLFTGQIGTLGRLLGSRGPIVISVTAGATLDFEVVVEDEFLIVLSREKHTWRAGVRKANKSKVTASVDAGITARLKDPKAVQTLVKGVIDAAIGRPLAQVEALLAKATLADLDATERRVFEEVAERLGLGGVIATLKDLKARLAELKAKADGLIADVVETRVRLSFGYEYSRVQTHVNLLLVTLNEKALGRFHADLVAGRTTDLLVAIRQGQAGVALESYLNQKTLTRAASWGFTLGIGKWQTVGGKDFRTVTEVEREDIAGALQRSYLGTRGYEGRWVGETFTWSVDLRADMKGYAKPVKVSSYSFGVHLAWSATQKSLSVDEIEQWIDVARLWQVVSDANAMEIRAALAPVLRKHAQVSVQLTVPNTVVRTVLPELATTTPEAFAAALAAAMPWLRRHEARQSVDARRTLYAPLWTRVLQGGTLSGAELARMASDHLREANQGDLAFFERSDPSPSNPFTFAGLAQMNGNVREICLRFTTGARALQSNITNDEEDKRSIPAAFRLMDDLWAQSHHVRAVGVRLLDLAAQAGQLHEITRTMLVQGADLKEDLVVTA
jgi:hypothetical protein